ncbi:quercetin dioxygenase-like cupin family protein [Catalinimonas alkaloidigena]|uniref:cupin domain-containing protein n=1 Tax=Catalinimonas alkaloidigena TaxID=1075417 RepID=UPI0024072E0C|nr:cupin domain-containing protein [Catalinimonas alkaloidigena]MDF9798577.1 quercetin dioxygenase-like cupin family protein [Catalinimonas alkaloidigena]
MKTLFPHTIENTTGEKITFLRITVKDGIEYLEGENEVKPKAGPPMHVHYKQDESFTVTSGKLGYQIWEEEKKYAGPGETILFKAGIPHKFWNAGSDILRCTGYISPAGNLDYFLTQIFKSSNENGGQPGIFDAAFLLRRYKSEFGMSEIPQFVQNVIFPMILFVGIIIGKYKKFNDAPLPM